MRVHSGPFVVVFRGGQVEASCLSQGEEAVLKIWAIPENVSEANCGRPGRAVGASRAGKSGGQDCWGDCGIRSDPSADRTPAPGSVARPQFRRYDETKLRKPIDDFPPLSPDPKFKRVVTDWQKFPDATDPFAARGALVGA
ncbi:hypothetical protein HPB47_018717 [Ixodes persulcatus]|uniref:Uncharacterized protein n=1 Tax=Ixodes persulcatus TaxID=34615 RepID=A0AC60QLZ2_IXOPE|nr:hypothetical protein HPB47_018717 [Ixodes persulcatus]